MPATHLMVSALDFCISRRTLSISFNSRSSVSRKSPLDALALPLAFVEAFQNFHYGFRGFLTYGLFKLFSVIK